MSTPSPDPTDLSTPKKVAFVSCETQTFKINIGIGDQSIKWLALAAAAKIADQRRGRGRITSRSPNVDGRLNVLPVPQCVTVGRSKKWLHPNIKITEVQARFGSTCILMVDLAYRPNLTQGVHERTVWGDLAFGGERGEERYQRWVTDQRSKGINVGGLSDDEEAEEEENKNGDDDDADDELERLRLEFENVWRGVTLEKYGGEMEIQKVMEYIFKHYVWIRDCFCHLTLSHLTSNNKSNKTNEEQNQTTTEQGTLSLAEVIHFVWQHDLDQCCSGLRKTVGQGGEHNKAILAQLEEENLVRTIAKLVCFGEENSNQNVKDAESKSTKSSKSTKTNNKMEIDLPKFIEILIRYPAAKKEKVGKGSKKNQGTFANAIALRQMLQRLEAPVNRRRNESVRKLMMTRSIGRVIQDTSIAVREVFENYCTADADKDRKNERNQNVMSQREFLLLMTDALLIGVRPGDDGPQATSAASKAFFAAQANDESAAIAFVAMDQEERAASSNVLEDLVFSEMLEAVCRVALDKWDDPEIPNLDKIQLAMEACAVLHQ